MSVGSLERGREALARGAWTEARDAFRVEVDREETPEALEGLGMAGWWLDDEALTFGARERAYHLYRERDDPRGAARIATWLSVDAASFRGEHAVANGWLARARRLLDGLEPGREHAWLALREGKAALGSDPAEAQRLGARAVAIARAERAVDFEMAGLALEGLALVTEGRVPEGMALLDEASAAAVAGELTDLYVIGLVCCDLIVACERVRDLERARQWCDRLTEFCRRWQLPSLFAVCRVHYGSVLTWRGTWREAENELAPAAETLARLRPGHATTAAVRLGELRRRQGRTAEARDLFEQVATTDVNGVLGLAELALDAGAVAEAAELAERHLRRVPAASLPERAPGLELLVRARVAAGAEAGAAVDELRAAAEAAGTDALRASAAYAAALACGDPAALDDAIALFERAGMPYEAARARLELAELDERLGRSDEARAQESAGREALERLGVGQPAERPPAGLSAREVEVLRLVAAGLTNREIAERLVLSEHTVHRHVANILRKLDLPSRAAASAKAAQLGLL